MALCENGNYFSLQLHRCGYKELCHRQLYQDLAGNALPAGVEIHHRDGDPRNNRAQNLEAMPRDTIGDFTDRFQERKKGAE